MFSLCLDLRAKITCLLLIGTIRHGLILTLHFELWVTSVWLLAIAHHPVYLKEALVKNATSTKSNDTHNGTQSTSGGNCKVVNTLDLYNFIPSQDKGMKGIYW